MFDPVFVRRTIAAAATALQEALHDPVPITHWGHAEAEVAEVASNRRILGEDGKVAQTRYTACKDPALRALPAGVVDPQVRVLTLFEEDVPRLVLTFFATHPQSYYRTGGANPDFPGIARQLRETVTGGVPHIHFNGAGGNIGAGKWNDGSKNNRMKLALRLAEGMEAAFERADPMPLPNEGLGWEVAEIELPVSEAFAGRLSRPPWPIPRPRC